MFSFEAQNSFEHIDKLSYDIGPRLAGSERSRQASEYIMKSFEEYGLETESQTFEFADKVLESRLKAVILLGIFLASFFLPSLVALVVSVGGIAFSYFLYRVLPKGEDINAVGRLGPEEDVEEQIVIGAHYDSARCSKNFNLNLSFRIGLPIVLAAFLALLILRNFMGGMFWQYGWLTLAVPYIFVSSIPFWTYEDLVSPGAEDNASGVSVMLEVARLASERDLGNKRLTFVAFGGEEQGLRGSKEFSKSAKDVDYVLNLDSLGSGESLCLIEGNGVMRKNRTSSSIKEKIDNVSDVGKVWTPFSGHDHLPFIEKGVPAATLTSSNPGERGRLDNFLEDVFGLSNVVVNRLPQIHTLDDIPEKLRLDDISKAGEIVTEFLDLGEE